MGNHRLTPAATTALAACAPQAALAELVEQYTATLPTKKRLYDPDSIFEDEAFEAAVLAREDKYLDLLLAGGIRIMSHAHLLWGRAVSAIEAGDSAHGEAIKERLIQVQGVVLIAGDEWFLSKSLTKIGQEIFPSGDEVITKLARIALRSEHNQHLVARIVSGGSVFPRFVDKVLCIVWDEIAENPSINLDRSDNELPDDIAWDIQKGVRKVLNNAPASFHWYFTISKLIDNLDPTVHILRGDWFDSAGFIERWSSTKIHSGYSDSSESLSGAYLNVEAGVELSATLVAKFHVDFPGQIKFKNFRDAEKSENLLSKAAFYGRGVWINDEFIQALKDDELSRESLYFLLFNPDLYESARACQIVGVLCEGWREGNWLFKLQQKKYLTQPDKNQAAREHGNLLQMQIRNELDPVVQMLGKVRADHEYVKRQVERIGEELKTSKHWILIFAGIWLLKQLF